MYACVCVCVPLHVMCVCMSSIAKGLTSDLRSPSRSRVGKKSSGCGVPSTEKVWLTDVIRPPASYTRTQAHAPVHNTATTGMICSTHTSADTRMACCPAERSSGLHGNTYNGPPTFSGFDARAFPSINTFTSATGKGEKISILLG